MTLRTVDLWRMSRITLVLGALAATLSAATRIGEAASLVLGTTFMLVNLHLIRMLVSRVMTPGSSPALSMLVLVLKFTMGLALIAGVFYRFPVEPMSFAFGATLLLVAVVLEASVTGDPVASTDDEHH